MTTELRWHVGLASAWCYAAAREALTPTEPNAVAEGSSGAAFSAEVAALTAFLAAEGIATQPFFSQLAALAPSCDARRDLAHKVLTKLLGRDRADGLTPLMVGLVGACEREYERAHPKLLEELRLRMGPLRELWEARGPGLVAGVGRRTERSLIVESATVALVSPLVGGDGEAYPATNVVRIEAVLVNSNDQLPEMVRLAWLVSQLATDQLEPAAPIISAPLLDLVSAAMLPAVLEAAADLDVVAGDDPDLWTIAIRAWNLKLLERPGAIDVVRDWWAAARNKGVDSDLPWNVKLSGLDRMLLDRSSAS